MVKRITILVFSDRNEGNCANIGKFISDHHASDVVTTFKVHDLTPCGNCDYECLQPNISCPNVTETQRTIMDTVRTSDLVYYIVPNLCGFPCAAYFAFNERSVGYFNMDRKIMQEYMTVKKKFIIVSNSENENFRAAMMQQTSEEPEMLYLKTGRYGKRSIQGDLMESEAAKADLAAFLEVEHP